MTKVNLEKKFLIKNKVFINPNYVVGNYYKTFEQRYSNKIISVGRLEEQNNYKNLIESLGSTNIQLDIIGDGSQKEILSTAEENKVKIELIKPIPNEELMKKNIVIIGFFFDRFKI